VHPVLTRRSFTLGYAALWIGVGFSLSLVEGLSWFVAMLLTVPLMLVFGFICLTPWYLCRLMPIRPDTALRVMPMQALAALVSASLWIVLGYAWTTVLSTTNAGPQLKAEFHRIQPALFALAVALFLLSSAVHYLVVAVDESRAAETRALRLQMLAAHAELRALHAQITPHFLFNSLNSISALTSTDPAGARDMCVLLGDFLRGTLQIGTLDSIPLRQELALVDQFLAIEQVRFGERLRIERVIENDTLDCRVPPLIVQPLAENALRHGVSQMLDGGTVRMAAWRNGDVLVLTIDNPIERAARPKRGSGLGLENVRRRIEAVYGPRASLTAGAQKDRYSVEITLPLTLVKEQQA
jgi:LytS/YehU family sensor histidine kinase